jgi:glucose dehydrogenase
MEIPAGQTGELFLCIDDDLNGIYGPGLGDNIGDILVTISAVL